MRPHEHKKLVCEAIGWEGYSRPTKNEVIGKGVVEEREMELLVRWGKGEIDG